jgi:4-hydroxythreonine-4-phosphate dehydrogenase
MITPHPHAPIAITMGDPAGIGPDIIVKLFAALMLEGAGAAKGLVVLGDGEAMRRAMQACGVDLPIISVTDDTLDRCWSGTAMPVLQCCELRSLPAFGLVSAIAGRAAYQAIIAGIDLALAGKVSALVTAPIHKEALKAAGVVEPGHTEILAHRSGSADFGMMLANDELRVMLVSIHVSLREAVAAVTHDSVVRAIRLADQGTRAFGIDKPRIAVAGLNPHAGEAGQFGREEIEIIEPAVRAARAGGYDVSGPFAPDTIFMRAREGAFDVVVAMYHDQGLIPVKYLGIDHGVNITVGLPFPRTSVDHGTAFDLAGTGKASASSLTYALDIARKMVRAS